MSTWTTHYTFWLRQNYLSVLLMYSWDGHRKLLKNCSNLWYLLFTWSFLPNVHWLFRYFPKFFLSFHHSFAVINYQLQGHEVTEKFFLTLWILMAGSSFLSIFLFFFSSFFFFFFCHHVEKCRFSELCAWRIIILISHIFQSAGWVPWFL